MSISKPKPHKKKRSHYVIVLTRKNRVNVPAHRWHHFVDRKLAEPETWHDKQNGLKITSKRVAYIRPGVWAFNWRGKLFLTDPQALIDSPRIRTNFATVASHYLIAHEGQMPLPIWFKLWRQAIREEYVGDPHTARELIREKTLWLRQWWEEQQWQAEGVKNEIVIKRELIGYHPDAYAQAAQAA